MEELITFLKSYPSGSGSRNYLKDSSAVEDGAFFRSLAHISRKTDFIFMKMLLSVDKEVPQNFYRFGLVFTYKNKKIAVRFSIRSVP